jgi:hypothetical protein
MKKSTIFLLLLLGFTISANAQFFKKLGNKVEKAAEKAVERKAEQKTTKETNKAFDSTFNKKRKKNKSLSGMPSFSDSEPAANYTFNYRADMEIKTGGETMKMSYFLSESGNYLSSMIDDKRMKDKSLMVMDFEREAMFTFMENDGQKIRMAMSLATASAYEQASNESNTKVTATGKSKKILNYNCQEYKMTGDDMYGTMWITKDVNARFPKNFYGMKQDKRNKNNTQAWMKDMNGWLMEMEMTDTSERKPQTMIMTCVFFGESNLSIDTKGYETLKF